MQGTCLICGMPTGREKEGLCAECIEAILPKYPVDYYFAEERELYYQRERQREERKTWD